MPHRARPHYANVRDFLPEFRMLATEAKRDPATLPVTIWGAKEDEDLLKRDRDEGVVRVIVSLESAKSDAILPELDRWSKLACESSLAEQVLGRRADQLRPRWWRASSAETAHDHDGLCLVGLTHHQRRRRRDLVGEGRDRDLKNTPEQVGIAAHVEHRRQARRTDRTPVVPRRPWACRNCR